MSWSHLATPALLLDRTRLERNTSAMRERAAEAGVLLRPHMKTAKSARVAELATDPSFRGITVSTLAEAEYFARHGFTDITYAVCITPGKLERAAHIARAGQGVRLTLITDNPRLIRELDRRALALGARFPVLIEIDCGEHRTGLCCESDELMALASALGKAHALELAGVLTHGGHSYACTDTAGIIAVAEQERAAVVRAAERLRAAGHPCDTVSAGSTPTAIRARDLSGLTEIRPGVYMFFDLAQYALGVCDWRDIAISVLATVIGHQPAHGRLIIDAGGLALSKDQSAAARLPATGYGWILDAAGDERIGDLHVAIADQEHGYVEGTDIPYDRLPVGSQVRVLPNHACMTAAAYDRYFVVRGGEGPDREQVVDAWGRITGW